VSAAPHARSTGIGSWPGTDLTEAVRIAFAECPDLPYLPELPGRGPWAEMVGRGTGLLPGLPADLTPSGWRLSDATGREHRQARATLRSDLDQLEEQAQGYAGDLKLAVAGPWTLAATLERPRGDRVLADSGARRDLVQSLAEGIFDLLGELHRRLPDIAWLIQLDEPLLPAVLAGSVATASGLGRYQSIDRPEISASYRYLVERLHQTMPTRGMPGPRCLVHCCAAGTPVRLLMGAGVDGVLVDVDQTNGPVWDEVAEAIEAGALVGIGALPTDPSPLARLGSRDVADRALRRLRALGLGPEIVDRLLVTPSCGLAGLDRSAAVRALRTVSEAAEIVTDELQR
jgi:methionine synthase II (cobalamin-independent)